MVQWTIAGADNAAIADICSEANAKGEPTNRAVTEHLYKLQGVNGVKKRSPAARKPKKPSPKTPRTPPSSAKASSVAASARDDSEREVTPASRATPTPRVPLPRSSKTRAAQYVPKEDPEDDSEDLDIKSEDTDSLFDDETITAEEEETIIAEEEDCTPTPNPRPTPFADAVEHQTDSPHPDTGADY